MGPLEFFKNENFDARAPKFWNWTSEIMTDLWLLDLFCPIKKMSTLHPVYYTVHTYTRIVCIWCYILIPSYSHRSDITYNGSVLFFISSFFIHLFFIRSFFIIQSLYVHFLYSSLFIHSFFIHSFFIWFVFYTVRFL